MARAAALAAASDANSGLKAGIPSPIARDTVSVVVSGPEAMRSENCWAANASEATVKANDFASV